MPDLTDHAAIREWTIARGGRPAIARTRTPTGGEHAVLRLIFAQPGARLDTYDQASDDATSNMGLVEWRDWFEAFDEHDLALRVGEEVDGELDSGHELVVRRS